MRTLNRLERRQPEALKWKFNYFDIQDENAPNVRKMVSLTRAANAGIRNQLHRRR